MVFSESLKGYNDETNVMEKCNGEGVREHSTSAAKIRTKQETLNSYEKSMVALDRVR